MAAELGLAQNGMRNHLNCSFRTAREADRASEYELYRLVMRGFVAEIWGWDEEWQRRDFSAHFDPDGITLGYVGQELAAYSQVEDRNDRLFIRMIVVDPQHQHSGIGRTLLEAVIASAGRQSRSIGLEVFRINAFAKAFYERHGFVVEGETSSSFVMWRA